MTLVDFKIVKHFNGSFISMTLVDFKMVSLTTKLHGKLPLAPFAPSVKTKKVLARGDTEHQERLVGISVIITRLENNLFQF